MQDYSKEPSRDLYKRVFIRAILGALLLLGAIFLPRAIGILLPFIIAFLVAMLVNPVTNHINERFGVSRRIIAIFLDLIVFLFFSFIIGLLIYYLRKEIISLLSVMQQNPFSIEEVMQSLETNFQWLINLLPPTMIEFINSLEESLMGLLQTISRQLLNSLVSLTGSFATRTGSFFIGFLMYIMAAYFLIVDYNPILALIKKTLGVRLGRYVTIVKTTTFRALGGYFRSQLLLALIAFIVMFTALGIYGQPYALLIALLLGIIDLLPIVGTISVLLPWGIISLASGDLNKGIFLLVLGVVFFLFRRIIEPKIVGSQTGLHPLAALISMFVGLQFSGVWGAIMGPVILMLLVGIYRSGIFDNTMKDLRDIGDDISRTLQRPEEPPKDSGPSQDSK